MTHHETLDEIIRLAASARNQLDSPPPTHLGGQLIPAVDQPEIGQAQVVLHVTRIRKLAVLLSVQLAKETVS